MSLLSHLFWFSEFRWCWHRERIRVDKQTAIAGAMADDTMEKMKTEMAERLRQFNERIDAAIDQ